jgi:hypothetical protein
MATIVTRSGKGSALTHAEADANLTNLNTDKMEGISSSTDNAIVRWDGTGGSTLQNTSTTTIDDNGDIVVGGTTPKITIGDGGAEDSTLVFDGNSQDYRVGLDDGTDKLEIGVGAAHGTTTALTVDSSQNVTFGAKLIMPDVTSGKILVGDGTSYEEVAVSGDVGLASNGAATIQSTSVESGMVNTNVITGQTEETSVADGDFLLIYDASATAFRKMQKSNFVSISGNVNVTTVGDEFSNYDTISSTVTTTVPSNSNGFLCGPITVGSSYSWTIASGSTINIL